jgi:hypothetical protein
MATAHYCHNCHCHDTLPDNVFCGYCLRFWADNGRMPVPKDDKPAAPNASRPETTALSAVYREMGWA